MSKPSNRKRAKHQERRAAARQRAKPCELPIDLPTLFTLAATKPFGPCWISGSYEAMRSDGAAPFVVVVVTRRVRADLLLAMLVLVDRTCLGVKHGLVLRVGTATEVAEDLRTIESTTGDRMHPCDALLAQSVVFHAIDYARRLGFAPLVPLEIFEPRPETLLETLHARRPRPFFRQEPDDDVEGILARLDTAVGPGNYDTVAFGDEDDKGDDIRDAMLRVDREPFMPVRLYYQITDPERARREVEDLGMEVGMQPLPDPLLDANAHSLTIEAPSVGHALRAASLLEERLDIRPRGLRIVNRCFEEGEETPESIARWLDRDAGTADADDVPLVEDLALDPDDESVMRGLVLALALRRLRALQHWAGDTFVTLGSLTRSVVHYELPLDA